MCHCACPWRQACVACRCVNVPDGQQAPPPVRLDWQDGEVISVHAPLASRRLGQ